MDSDENLHRRQSSVARAASSLRRSVASAASAVEEQIEVGTIGGTVLNTTCNVIGAGVLSLPLAAYNGSLGLTIILTVIMGLLGALSAYILFIGCDRTGAFFMNEIFAVAIMGKPHKVVERHAAEGEPTSPLVPGAARTESESIQDPAAAPEASDPNVAAEADRNTKRMLLSLVIDSLIFINNYMLLAVYARIIIDSIPPVIGDFLRAPPTSVWVHKGLWAGASGVIFFGLTSVRNMAELKWSSILGIATIMYAALAMIIEFFRLGYQGTDAQGHPDTRDVQYFEFKTQFPAAIATLSVAYSYHYNAPIFYHELQDRTPRRMMKTVSISFPVIAVTYIAVAVFGYLSFGKHVADSSAAGEVINNYPDTNTLINTVRLGLFFHFACVYPVLSVCVRHSFHRLVLTALGRRAEAIHPDMPARVPRWVIVLEAFTLVSTSSVFAYFYDNVGQLIIYIGAVCGSNIMFTVPGIIGMCIWAPGRTQPGEERLVNDHGAAEYGAVGDHDGESFGQRYDDVPHADKRGLMFGISAFIAVLGYVCTVASFAVAVLG